MIVYGRSGRALFRIQLRLNSPMKTNHKQYDVTRSYFRKSNSFNDIILSNGCDFGEKYACRRIHGMRKTIARVYYIPRLLEILMIG